MRQQPYAISAVIEGRTLAVTDTETLRGRAILCAEVERPPCIDTWERLLYRYLHDGFEFPVFRTSMEAVTLWGGRLLIQPPAAEA